MAAFRGARFALGAEVALAFTAGIAAFVLVSLAVIAGNSDGLIISLLAICIATVALMFRFWGVEYAVPAALAAALAFDWFYIPPTHPHDLPKAENLANLFALLAVGVFVGQLAAYSTRRADLSEVARGELADEQAALRRVATLVAQGVAAPRLLTAVAKETATLLNVDGAWIEFYEGDEVAKAAEWSRPGRDPPTFDRAKLEDAPVAAAVRRSGDVQRVDDFDRIQPSTRFAEGPRVMSLAGAPITVEGSQWGLLLAWSQDEPLPGDTEAQLTAFTDLVATAIANSDARAEVRRLADQQAALRRVATLVARETSPEQLFSTVCEEVGRVLGVEEADIVRLEGDGTFTVLSFAGRDAGNFPVGTRLPLEGRTVVSLVAETERPTRIDDYSTATGRKGEFAKGSGVRSAVGCPVVVQGRLWGVVFAATRGEEALPADTESRIGEFTELVATAIANAEARREVATLADEQAALRRVATLVAEGAAPAEMFAAVARELGQLLRVDSTYLSRYEPDDTSTGVGSWSAHGADLPMGTHVPHDSTSVAGLVHHSGQPARLDNYQHASGEVAEIVQALGIRSSVGAPVIVEGQPWGVLIASSNHTEPLPADTESRIAAFSELVATAISNTQARSETRRLAEEQAALRRVATLVAEGVPPPEVFAAVAREVGQLLDVDSAHLACYEPDRTVMVVGSWGREDKASVGTRVPLDETTVTGLVYASGRAERLDSYEKVSGEIAEILERLGSRSSVGAPITVDGHPWGVMVASSNRPEPLPAGAEARIAAFTDLVATAISNTEARAETRRLADEQAALRHVATLVAQDVPPEELFQAVVEKVGTLFGTDLATLLRYEDENTATLVSTWTADGAPLEGPRTWSMTEMGLTRTAAQSNWPTRVDDWNEFSGPLAEYVRDVAGVTSSVGSPVIVEGRLWGALAVHSTREEPVPVGAELRLGQFTELVATAISNTQARSDLAASRARIVAATDDERRRVVRDLHDGAQQRLVHTVVKLKMASRALQHDSDQASRLMEEALQHAKEATDELRELSHGILPSVLTQGGLRAGVRALASRMSLPVETKVSVDRLPPTIEATAYFIVAEALTNVAKHSHATRAVVTARTENGTLNIQVRDDGAGGAKAAGTGLVGLADRVAALEGSFRLESPDDEGTLVAADIPLR